MSRVATHPERALAYLHELSPLLRSAAILDGARTALAGSPPSAAVETAAGLQLEATRDGMVAVAVAPPGVPSALVEHDLRLALSEASPAS